MNVGLSVSLEASVTGATIFESAFLVGKTQRYPRVGFWSVAGVDGFLGDERSAVEFSVIVLLAEFDLAHG